MPDEPTGPASDVSAEHTLVPGRGCREPCDAGRQLFRGVLQRLVNGQAGSETILEHQRRDHGNAGQQHIEAEGCAAQGGARLGGPREGGQPGRPGAQLGKPDHGPIVTLRGPADVHL